MTTALAQAAPAIPAENVLYGLGAVIGTGNLAAGAAIFTKDGCLITPDGTAVHGRGDIAEILAQMIAHRTEIEFDQLAIQHAGDVALVAGRMRIRSAGLESRPITQLCEPTAVLHRVEGRWKVAILDLWKNVRQATLRSGG